MNRWQYCGGCGGPVCMCETKLKEEIAAGIKQPSHSTKEFCIAWSDTSGIEFIIKPNDVTIFRELELNGFVQITENSMHYMNSMGEGKQKLIDLGFVENSDLLAIEHAECILITDSNIDEYEAKDKTIAEKLQSAETSPQEPASPETELKNKIKSQFPTIEFTETVRHTGKIQVTGDIILGDRTVTIYTYDAKTYNIFNITGGFENDDINMLTKIISKCNIHKKEQDICQ